MIYKEHRLHFSIYFMSIVSLALVSPVLNSSFCKDSIWTGRRDRKKPPRRKEQEALLSTSEGSEEKVSLQSWGSACHQRTGSITEERTHVGSFRTSVRCSTLTCHQRLKLSFTTHLFFTVLTWHSKVTPIKSRAIYGQEHRRGWCC